MTPKITCAACGTVTNNILSPLCKDCAEFGFDPPASINDTPPIAVSDEEVLPVDASEEMVDSVRYLLVAIEQPGRTYGSVRKHCELSGMDVSHWPEWTRGCDKEHFAKAACAALIWHCMRHAALESFTKRKAGEE